MESPKDPTNNIDKLTIDSVSRPQTPDRTVRLLYGVYAEKAEDAARSRKHGIQPDLDGAAVPPGAAAPIP